MAPKKGIQISEDVNLNDDQEQEDPPTASKKERLPGAWMERARASKRKGISKAREDPPTSSSAETTMKRRPSCSHPSTTLGV